LIQVLAALDIFMAFLLGLTLLEAKKYATGEWKKAHNQKNGWKGWNVIMPGCGVNKDLQLRLQKLIH